MQTRILGYKTTKQAKATACFMKGTVESVESNHNKPIPKSSQSKLMSKTQSKQSKFSHCGSINSSASKPKCGFCKKQEH